MAVAADFDVGTTLDEVRELARDHTLVPLRHTFIDDIETPVSAYLKLRGEGPSFLLESAEQGQRVGRWSFLGVAPRTVMRLEGGGYEDPYGAVAQELERYRLAPLEGLPPFSGGAVGMFGYDLVRSAEPTVGEPNADEVGVPDLALMVSDVLVAFDHFTHTVTVLANVFVEGDEDLAARYAEAVTAIVDVRERLSQPVPRAAAGVREPPEWVSNMGSDGFGRAVDIAKEYIRAGDVYQVVPSQRWSADAPVEPFSHGLHIVSSVSGPLRDEVPALDALRPSLPAGTLSGAPKIRAMQIIDEFEPVKRGPYGGAIGYLSYSGDLDACIYIRSAVFKDGRMHIQAGGGIVADSDPAYEVRETEAKAGAVWAAVALACSQPEWA